MSVSKKDMIKILTAFLASFPDFTFNLTQQPFTKNADGSWTAQIYLGGTHSGVDYSPVPGVLPAVPAKGKYCRVGPEEFTLYFDEDGKIIKETVRQLSHSPSGPPGMYMLAGGTLPSGWKLVMIKYMKLIVGWITLIFMKFLVATGISRK